MKSLKNCLVTFGAFFGFLFVVYIIFAYFALDVHRDVVFTLNNWENAIEKDEPVKLKFIREEKYRDSLESKNVLIKSYYLINFKNSIEDFKLIERELEIAYKSRFFEGDSSFKKIVIMHLYWNTYSNIARYIRHPETSDLATFLGLFSIESEYLTNGFYYKGILNSKNLNVKDVRYSFERRGSNTIETNANSFNFIFWYQAREYLAKKGYELKGKRILFLNKDNKIVEFEFNSSGNAYKLSF